MSTLKGIAGGFLVGVALCVFIVRSSPEEPTNEEQCLLSSIIASSFQACQDHPLCQMSNDELATLYVERKKSIVYCAAATMEGMLREANEAMDGQPEPEGDLTAQNSGE